MAFGKKDDGDSDDGRFKVISVNGVAKSVQKALNEHGSPEWTLRQVVPAGTAVMLVFERS